ncbi:helix-turn-helix domain-containing protein [Nocardioides marinquilinus]|uniref:Helix-turn-helix domain-containing protein n=1 Tax=Nocardioides marinquilinus TaxID=1210400 RepID=A0ABP9PH28_9ACTN
MAARRKATSSRAGILRPAELARHAVHERTPCRPELDPWVENHWSLRWSLPPGTTFTSHTLPHPACTLSVELGHPRAGVGDDRVVLTGVVTRRFDVEIADDGWVHAVKFRPGGLAALTGQPARPLTDRTVPARGLLPDDVVEAFRSVGPGTSSEGAAATTGAAVAAWAAGHEVDPDHDLVLRLVGDMLADRTLLRVAQVEERHGVPHRRLQRLFAHYVGVGPKWVLARYRMHDVVSALDAGYDGSLADLAATHGWYDQAHFGRDFRRLVGVAPSDYRARAQPV